MVKISNISCQLAVQWKLGTCGPSTTKKCLYFKKGELKPQRNVDADFAGDVVNRRSTTTHATLGTTAVSWTSQLQKIKNFVYN